MDVDRHLVIPGAIFADEDYLRRRVDQLSEWDGRPYVHYSCGENWEHRGGCTLTAFLAWMGKMHKEGRLTVKLPPRKSGRQ